jgi:hypothetical protein
MTSYTPPRITLTDALDMFDEHIPDIKQACIENIAHVVSQHHVFPHHLSPPDDIWCVRCEVEKLAIEQKVAPMRRVLARIVSREQRRPFGSITDEMIARANERDIHEVFTTIVGTPVHAGMSTCPLHDDKTASFSMRRHNRYRCFGCDARGSVIDLYMKVQGVGFIQAVRALQ